MKKMLARFLIFILIFTMIQPIYFHEGAQAAGTTDSIPVTLDKFVENDTKSYKDGDRDGAEYPYIHWVGFYTEGGKPIYSKAALQFDLPKDRVIEKAELKIEIKRINIIATPEPETFMNIYGSKDDAWTESDTKIPDPNDHTKTVPIVSKEVLKYPGTNVSKKFDVTSFIVEQQQTDQKASFVLTGPDASTGGDTSHYLFYDKLTSGKGAELIVTYAAVQLSKNQIAENNNVGDTIGTLSTPGMTATSYTRSGVDADAFTIAGNQLKANQSFDFETKNSYTVTIEAKDGAGATMASKEFTIQVTNVDEPPTAATIAINAGAIITNNTDVTLGLTHNDPDSVPQYRLSNNGVDGWSEWKAFAATVPWRLSSGDENKTVYMELQDTTGGVIKAQDDIVLDTTSPTVTGVANNTVYNTDVKIDFTEGTATLNGSPFTSGTKVSSDNNYLLIVTDAAGNTTTITFIIDRTAPTGSVNINSGAAYTRNQDVMLTVDGRDGGSGNVQMSFSSDNTTWTAFEPFLPAKPFTLLPPGEGEKTVYMKLMDGAGNTASFEDQITLDMTPPTATMVINEGKEATSTEKVALTISASDVHGAVQVSLSNDSSTTGDWQPVPPSNTLDWTLASGDGEKTVYATFRDGAGNEKTISDTIMLDTKSPIVSGVVDGSFYNTDVTPTFTEGTATLDGDSFTSGTTIKNEGVHTLVVKDAANNTTTVTFTIDKTAPTGSLVINNGDTHTKQSDVNLQITFTDANAGVQMQFSSDNTTWSAPESAATSKAWTLPSGDGSKTVYMKLIDRAGNTVDLQKSITLDTVLPVVTGVENNKLYSENVTIHFNEGTATLNGKKIEDGEVVSEDGEYTLVVTDEAGNQVTLQFSVDVTKPTGSLSINNGAAMTNTLASTLKIDVNDSSSGLQMRFTHDNSDPASWSAWEALAPTKPWTLLAGDGSKTVFMEVKDQAGNTASMSDEIVLDMIQPTGSITINEGKDQTNASKVTLGIESADTHKVQMRLSNDNVTWSAWEAAPAKGNVSWELDGSDGIKTVYVELKDEAGNQISYQDQITLDTKAPVVTGVADNQTYSNDVTITFDEGTALLNGTPFTSGSVVSTEGTHKLVVTDSAQNSTTVTFTLDKTPPTGSVSINEGAEFTTSEDVTLQINVPGDTNGIEMLVSNVDDSSGTWEKLTETKTWNLADGSTNGIKTVYVKLRDKADNMTKLSDTIELDAVAPTGSISINNGAGETKSRDVTLTVTASDSTSDVQVRFANGDSDWSGWEAPAGTKAWKLTADDGTKTVEMEIKDEAGNVTTVSDTIELDAGVPVVKGVEDKGIYNEDVTITFNEGTATLNGASFASGDQVTSEGVHELRVVDAAGNETVLTFTLDKTAPDGSIQINGGAEITTSTQVKLDITATDALGDVEMRISNEKAKWTDWEKIKADVTWRVDYGNGKKKVLLELRDEAGNTASFEDTIELYIPHRPDPPTGEPVTGVELDEEELSLRIGETETLRAKVKPSNATNKRVKWESSDPDIARVDEEGKITAISAGTAIITVTTEDGNKTATCEVTVKDKATFKLEASEASFWLKPKAKATFKLYKVDGKKRTEITKDNHVEYETENELVTIKQGRITAGKTEGEDTITVIYLGEELEIPVTVSKKTIRSLIPSQKEAVLEEGDEVQLTLTAIYSDKNEQEVTELATWSSSDEDVVEVTEDGELTAQGEGRATITATYGGKKVTIRILVVEEKELESLRASSTSIRLRADKTGEVILYGVYNQGYKEVVTEEVEWTVEDSEIVTVEKGVITALKPGRTKITVEFGGETVTIKISVW
ncbi:Ig-like domain-containing protein [Brevibacillus sp. 179-C9.3 HS]|uniref:Ig-like domain-containing protein n=1 Tax=unclassified Brevibacillus TaxID=2684853 RepID=UPI00399F5233